MTPKELADALEKVDEENFASLLWDLQLSHGLRSYPPTVRLRGSIGLDMDQPRSGSYRAIRRGPFHNSTGASVARSRARSRASSSLQYISLASSTLPSRVNLNAMK